ncbi:MAG: YgiQ family radical SAM protein, partial [Bacteroidaceae bacterium]|nr:YgiQ family radical SAM protein [Bacteroidaceae bacterium]
MKLTWLPTTKKECEQRGWQQLDVILFSADAYVDHPAFGVAVIGRLLESLGLRVAIVPQPDWHGDYRDFRKLGRPRYFFGISPGAMDSMVNKYTAARRLRSEDAYSPDGRHDKRPEYPTIVYTRILKQLWPDVPVVLGGIEASMRRLTHYDYWQQRLRPSILIDSGADLITYGLGEQPTEALVRLIDDKLLHGRDEAFASAADLRQLLHKYPVPQTVRVESQESRDNAQCSLLLHSHEACLADRRKYAENFRIIEEESNSLQPRRIIQETLPPEGERRGGLGGSVLIIVEPPFPPMTTKETDRTYDLPSTRLPHPEYRGKRIPAYEMIRHSVTIHRGCFGGCAFCTISA